MARKTKQQLSAPPIGTKIGRREVISVPFREQRGRDNSWFIRCRCSCGRESDVALGDILQNRCKGCVYCRRRTHGHTAERQKTPEYKVWASMRARCRYPSMNIYPYYGGRGITVCEEWNDFTTFFRDMGPKPFPEAELDRIDTDGPYAPHNCRWVTKVENANNQRNNVWLEWQGRRQTIAQWAREVGLDQDLVNGRIRTGWAVERALTTPSRIRPRAATSPQEELPPAPEAPLPE